jgi:hypothetical protein
MNWRSNKKFSVALLHANFNFQKERINRQKSKKKNETRTYQKKSSKDLYERS